MDKKSRIHVAGQAGLAGSAILRVEATRIGNLVSRTHSELDLTNRPSVQALFAHEKPEYVLVGAAKVGGILANRFVPGSFHL
jgi:GDP-L-fucose synthase